LDISLFGVGTYPEGSKKLPPFNYFSWGVQVPFVNFLLSSLWWYPTNFSFTKALAFSNWKRLSHLVYSYPIDLGRFQISQYYGRPFNPFRVPHRETCVSRAQHLPYFFKAPLLGQLFGGGTPSRCWEHPSWALFLWGLFQGTLSERGYHFRGEQTFSSRCIISPRAGSPL